MTVEEALLALLAAVAGILLFLGLAQALDSAPPRHARQRYQRAPGSSRYGRRGPTVGEPASGSATLAERRLDRHSEPAGEEPAETAAPVEGPASAKPD